MPTRTFLCIQMFLMAVIAAANAEPTLKPDLADAIRRSAPGEFIPVNFVLQDQVDFNDIYPHVVYLPKLQRRWEVIAALKHKAESTQAGLLKDLQELEAQDLADRIRPLWISNVIAARVQNAEIESLVRRHGEIAYASWDPPRPFEEIADSDISGKGSYSTDDISWGVADINAPEVWNLGYFGQGVLIANLDTGVDYNHPDLANHIWVNPGEDLNGNGLVDPSDWNNIDDDGNGYIDDLRGWAFDYNNSEVMDPEGHGTATAGIVLGDGTGGNQTGVAPEATMMILKNYAGGESAYWEAQQYAILMGADVITCSQSYKWRYNPKPDYATMRHNTDMELTAGIIHSNSIGNEGDNLNTDPIPFNVSTPGNCPPPWLHPDQTLIGRTSSTVGIGAYGANHVLKAYSSIGPSAWYLDDILSLEPNYPWQASWPPGYDDYPYQGGLEQALLKPDLAAPTDVVTTNLGGGYRSGFNGTSAATPHAGGTLCLLLSANPDATPERLAQALMTTAIDMGAPGKDNYWGAGRLDAYAAMVDILSEISGTLTGTVLDSNTSLPILEASVDLPELQLFTQTDSSGSYILPGIPAGNHDVRFAANGYDTLIVPDIAFNIGEAETLSVSLTGPQISVETEEISATLSWGDSLQEPVVVHNTGSSELDVNFSKQGNWAPYQIYSVLQAQEATNDDKLFGVEVAGGFIWVAGGNGELEPNLLYKFSYEGDLLETLEQPPSPSTWGWWDMAWDGQYLYGSADSDIKGVDFQGNVMETISGPLNVHRALAYDPASDHFFAADNTSDIVELDRGGATINSWPHSLHIQGLGWHPQDEDGYPLYIFSQDGSGALLRVSKMDPLTGDVLFVTDLLGASGELAGGATISGEVDPDRWCFVGMVQATLDRIQIHSLNAYAPWLTMQPEAATILPGEILEAAAFLNAGIVPPGSYNINLVVQHNAPGSDIVIPASLLVEPTAVETPSPATALPKDFAVGPVYPHPFNAETVIPIELPQRSQVYLTLYNLLGQEVAHHNLGILDAGIKRARINCMNLASGIYLCRIKAEGLEKAAEFEDVGKMVLLK